jgi:hypothetical protein
MTIKLKKNIKIATALIKGLGMVMHEGRRMMTKTTSDVRHAMRLIARANAMGGSNNSFSIGTLFQPVHSSPPKIVENGFWTVQRPMPKLSAS